MKERQFEGLRTKLLRGAADFYGKLLVLLKSQTDPKSRAALGKAYDELGELTGKIGNKPEALAVHLKALAVRRELAAEAGAGPTAQPGLAGGEARRGAEPDRQRTVAGGDGGHARGAGVVRGGAGPGRGTWRRRVMPRPRVQAVLGTSHLRIGRVLYTTGKPAEALAEYEQARAIRQTLADANPAVTEYQSDLADSHYNIGLLLGQTSRPNESLAAFEQARAILQKLADANPSVH